jgi:hypothetical protein
MERQRFSTEFPSIVMELGLDPYSLYVYIFLWTSSQGDKRISASMKFLSSKTTMSETTLKKSLKILQGKFKLLGNKSLIYVINEYSQDGGRSPNVYEIVDIWEENKRFFHTENISKNKIEPVLKRSWCYAED